MKNQGKDGAESGSIFSGLTEDDDVIVNDAAHDGANDGADDGANDGADDGANDGAHDGADDGANDGADDGASDGADDGANDGADDGEDQDFDPDSASLSIEGEDDEASAGESGTVDYIRMAKRIGLSIEEDTSELSEEDFFNRVNDHIENSKQKFSFRDVPEENQAIVKYFAEEGGSVADLLADDDVVLASSLLQMPSKDKYVMARSRALVTAGLSKEEADERVAEELDTMSEKELAQAVDRIDGELEQYKRSAIKKHLDFKKSYLAKEAERRLAKAQAERKQMVSVINSMDQFMGMKLPQEVKAKIAKDIESGEMDKTLSGAIAKAKVESYLLTKFGKQVSEFQDKLLKRSTAASYNKGVKKYVEKNHNHIPESRERGASKGEKQRWANLKDID